MIKGQVAYDLMSRLPGDIWDFDADADDGCSMVQTVAVESHVCSAAPTGNWQYTGPYCKSMAVTGVI